MKTDIKYVLTKNNILLETNSFEIVRQFRKLGWKFKITEFGELI